MARRLILSILLLFVSVYLQAQVSESIKDYKELFETSNVDFSKREIRKSKNGLFLIRDFFENGKIALIGETKVVFPEKVEVTESKTVFYDNGNTKQIKKVEEDKIINLFFFKSGELYKEEVFYLKDRITKVNTVKGPLGNELVSNGSGVSKEVNEINGLLYEEVGAYEMGVKIGEWKAYSENNKLLFVENYDKKGSLKGISYNEDGTTNKYTNENKEVPFKGGANALHKFLTSTVEIPAEAMRMNISGRVSVRFLLTKTGEIKDIECLNNAPEILMKEAFRVVEKSKGKWNPIKKKGFDVDEYFMLPIVFTIPRV